MRYLPPIRRRWLLLTLCLLLALVIGIGADRRASDAATGYGCVSQAGVKRSTSGTIRVASFNIHSGVGLDGVQDLKRIARLLKPYDFVGLNEVRQPFVPGLSSQAQQLASLSEQDWLFAPAERQWWCDHYGNGVLSRLQIGYWSRQPLRCTKGKGYRNLIDLEATLDGRSVRIFVTHIDRGQDREAQLERVIRQFLALPAATPAILMGDFNTTADDPLLNPLFMAANVTDCVSRAADRSADRIDWIFARNLECVSAGRVDAGVSDHPLVWAELRIADRPGAVLSGAGHRAQ